jgi:phosphatidylserine/phosphatidylglycerophosphate/cardiolipin synthase-like enzyme
MRTVRSVRPLGAAMLLLQAAAAHGQAGTATEVFFSQVYNTAAKKYDKVWAQGYPGSIDRKLAAFIDATKKTLDAALFEIHNDAIVGALIRAHQRGVKVRLVSDSQYREKTTVRSHQCPHYERIEQAGIPIVYDTKTGLMHNKFLVRDGYCVWTGSFNSVDSDAWENHNNAIKICSKKLAENFTTEFNEMFVDKKFGPDSPANTSKAPISVGTMKVESCFAPEDNCGRTIVDTLQACKTRIRLMSFSITDFIPRGPEPLSVRKTMPTMKTVILAKKKAGVDIQAVLEGNKIHAPGSLAPVFLEAGIPIRADSNPALLHSKVITCDGKVTIIGSFNFSAEAENGNDENMLIVTSPAVARKYEQEFQRIWDWGRSPAGPRTCDPAKPLDINTARVQDLGDLPGMGWKGAGLIKANRPYRSVDDLVTKGVMPQAKLDTIKQCLTVGSAQAAPR